MDRTYAEDVFLRALASALRCLRRRNLDRAGFLEFAHSHAPRFSAAAARQVDSTFVLLSVQCPLFAGLWLVHVTILSLRVVVRGSRYPVICGIETRVEAAHLQHNAA